MEVKRSIPKDRVIQRDQVRLPLMVQRRDVVTVYVRVGGIEVRANARAREDGSYGDVIQVESLGNRKRLLARVIAPQEVEVFAPTRRARRDTASFDQQRTLR